MAKILLVDDEKTLFRDGMEAVLKAEGYEVVVARDGIDGVKRFAAERPDLVLLDVEMPRKNGFAACGEIREIDAKVPILFLTNRDSEVDQVRGLGLGADDYIAKDAGASVIIARIRCALARSDRTGISREKMAKLDLGDVVIDFNQGAICFPDGTEEHLTATEMALLSVLVDHQDILLSPDEIIAVLRGAGYACEDSLLYTHLSRLRRKLGAAASHIVNVHGSGYRFVR